MVAAAHNVQNTAITKAQFVKNYRAAEKRAVVSAGGMAFHKEDRIALHEQRVALNFDYSMAANAVSETPEMFMRHWQRFQHWERQIRKGSINVAPQADYIADRTHKSSRTVKPAVPRKATPKTPGLPFGLSSAQTVELANHVVASNDSKAEALEELSMVFATKEEAIAHLQATAIGLARVAGSDVADVMSEVEKALNKAKEDLMREIKAQTILKALEQAGVGHTDAMELVDLARSLIPAA